MKTAFYRRPLLYPLSEYSSGLTLSFTPTASKLNAGRHFAEFFTLSWRNFLRKSREFPSATRANQYSINIRSMTRSFLFHPLPEDKSREKIVYKWNILSVSLFIVILDNHDPSHVWSIRRSFTSKGTWKRKQRCLSRKFLKFIIKSTTNISPLFFLFFLPRSIYDRYNRDTARRRDSFHHNRVRPRDRRGCQRKRKKRGRKGKRKTRNLADIEIVR